MESPAKITLIASSGRSPTAPGATIVRRAMGGTRSVSGLARLYPMSTTAVQKHVAVLEEAGLVHRTRRSREQLVQTNIDIVAEAER